MKDSKLQLPTHEALTTELVRLVQLFNQRGDFADAPDGIDITLGADETGYALQTGDNSFTGAAYGFRFWGVSAVDTEYTREDCANVATELLDEVSELYASEVDVLGWAEVSA
jgi:hypothetical protein